MRDKAAGGPGGPAAGHREDLPRLPHEHAREAVRLRRGEGEDRAPDDGPSQRRPRSASGRRSPPRPPPTSRRSTAWPRRRARGRSSRSSRSTYKNPVNLAFRPDGREVWVACEASGSVIVVDAARRVKVAEIPVGGQATDVAFSPDGHEAYVTNRLDDSVVGDRRGRRARSCRRSRWGTSRTASLTDRSGQDALRAGTAFDRDLSVIDLATGKETKRLAASRNPWSLALSPGRRRAAGHERALAASAGSARRRCPRSRCSTPGGQRVEDRWVVPEANLLLGVAWHPSGEFALATLNRTKNLVPMTRILQGWTITNGLAVLWKDGRVDQVLLDEPQRYFADVTDVAFTPGREDGLRDERGDGPGRRHRRREARGARRADLRRGPSGRASQLARRLGRVRDRARPGEGQPARDHGRPGRGDGLGGEHARRLAERDRRGAQRRPWRGSISAGRSRGPTSAGASSSSTARTSPSSASSPAPPATPTATSTASPTTSRPTASG